MPRQVFISHKNTEDSNDVVKEIKTSLDNHGYDCFSDDENLFAGMNWKSEITTNLIHSDVVVVVLDEETNESDWVQREIDIARSREISLLPVIIGNYEKVAPALDRFDMKEDQFVKWRWPDKETILDSILEQIAPLTERTIKNQRKMYDEWKDRRKFTPDVQHNVRHAVYYLPGKEDLCEFVIVTGDATEMSDYDILVNTENDYMQMARFFEFNTLSAQVRWKGAQFTPTNMLIQDTVQQQLNEQLINMRSSVPVGECTVIPTFAGNEDSLLRDKGFTYIFHAASVKIDRMDRKISSLPADKANPEIIKNALELAKRIYDHDGAILYDDMKIMASADDKKDIESILFPVFGAGKGGITVEEAISGIIQGFKKYFERQTEHVIKRVGICIYDFNEVQTVESIFEKMGFKPAE